MAVGGVLTGKGVAQCKAVLVGRDRERNIRLRFCLGVDMVTFALAENASKQ